MERKFDAACDPAEVLGLPFLLFEKATSAIEGRAMESEVGDQAKVVSPKWRWVRQASMFAAGPRIGSGPAPSHLSPAG